MFGKWLGTCSPRRTEIDNRFRPQLEYLEGRLAPSSFSMADDNHGNGDGNNNDGGSHSGQNNNPGNDNEHNNIHINDHDNYNIHETNSFNVVIDNLNVNQFFNSFGTSLPVLEQELFATLGQALLTTQGATITDALSLVTQEFQLGQDTGMLLQGLLSGGSTNQTLLNTIHNLQTTIQTNILETSSAGAITGSLAFSIGLQASLPQMLGQQGH